MPFVSSSSEEIFDVLGVRLYYVLSDQPHSFRVVAGGGERVGVWMTENPLTSNVTINVQVDTDAGGALFRSEKEGASRLTVSRSAPHIACEFDDGHTLSRLDITLFPHLRIDEASHWLDTPSTLPE